MKRFLSLALCVFLILGLTFAYADDVYDKPILFRGVEWGSSYDVAMKAIPEDVRMYALDDGEYWYSMNEYMFDPSNTLYKGVIGASVSARSSSLGSMQVAGYEVTGLKLYFTYLPGEDGLLVKDADHTSLICAYYCLEPKDMDAAFSDLTNKLSSLYGDVDLTRKYSPYISYEQALWNGAEGTMVSIVREDYPSGSHYLYIKYGFSGGDALMEAAYDAVVREEVKNAESNVDGL